MCLDKPLHEIFGVKPSCKKAFSNTLLQHKHVTVTGTFFCAWPLFLLPGVALVAPFISFNDRYNINTFLWDITEECRLLYFGIGKKIKEDRVVIDVDTGSS